MYLDIIFKISTRRIQIDDHANFDFTPVVDIHKSYTQSLVVHKSFKAFPFNRYIK